MIAESFVLISLYLPFGNAYYPCIWYIVSEFICDLANALLRCYYWKADKLDFENKNSIPPLKVDFKRELVEVLPIDVLVDTVKRGKVFCYIDALIIVSLYF